MVWWWWWVCTHLLSYDLFFQVETKLLQCSKAQGFVRLQHWRGVIKIFSPEKKGTTESIFPALLVASFAILSSNYRIGFSKTGYHDDHHCWIFALMDPLFLTRFEFLFFFSMTKIADKVRLLKAPWFKRIFHEEEFDRIKIWKKAFFTKYEVLFPFDGYYYITQNDITVYSNPKNSCQTLTLQKEEAIKI